MYSLDVKIVQARSAAGGQDPTGTFTLEPVEANPGMIHRIKDYMQYWIEADRLAADSPHSLEEFVEAVEPTFSDLINSNEWLLIDAKGIRLPMYAPTFTSDGKVRWRWRKTS